MARIAQAEPGNNQTDCRSEGHQHQGQVRHSAVEREVDGQPIESGDGDTGDRADNRGEEHGLSGAGNDRAKVGATIHMQSGIVSVGILLDGQATRRLVRIRMRTPVPAPRMIWAVGINYRDHAAETGRDAPGRADPVRQVARIGDRSRPAHRHPAARDPARLRGRARGRDRHASKDVTREHALQYVAGLTIAHDVSARDHQFTTGQFTWSKSFDTFCPLGPEVVSLDEVDLAAGLPLETQVNGEVMQSSNTSELIFDVPALIAWISPGPHAGTRRRDPHRHAVGRRRGTHAAALAARRRHRRDLDRRAGHPAQSRRPPVARRSPRPNTGRVG